ncbi:MAG: RNA polymerase sigma-70 factor [Spirochaetales bacterium]|nr:RNA polymerase sigma-70 factor [Leptospiraceae bacterium]MCP5480149.1 RNA polymerase sigma-70 factor [Spirochaetales bacterium]MCP5485511.1 RNA polymerase sigma-70 factor [Spirochaetales bacterium]
MANVLQSAFHLEEYERHRSLLFGIAYRMLGSVMDAEDLLQEAFLDFQKHEPGTVRNARGLLSTIVTRRAMDELKSARVRREAYVGPWLPEPLPDPVAQTPDPALQVERDESLSMAFLVLLERLNPVERAVYLLREIFDFDFDEIGAIVEREPANCRKILSRARDAIARDRPRFEPRTGQQQELLQRFLDACASGNLETLLELLASDVRLYSDGGGKAAAALNVLSGPDRVARFFIGVVEKAIKNRLPVETRPTILNGALGITLAEAGPITTALALEFRDGKIADVFLVRNPDKLRHLQRDGMAPGGPISSEH